MFTVPFLLVVFNLLIMAATCAALLFAAIMLFWLVVIGIPWSIYRAFKWMFT